MYTSRNYKTYVRYNIWKCEYEQPGKDVTFKELKERRKREVLDYRRMGFRFRIWLKAFKVSVREKLIENGYMTEDGVYKL